MRINVNKKEVRIKHPRSNRLRSSNYAESRAFSLSVNWRCIPAGIPKGREDRPGPLRNQTEDRAGLTNVKSFQERFNSRR